MNFFSQLQVVHETQDLDKGKHLLIFYGPYMLFIPAVYPVQDFFVGIAQTPQKNYGPSLINK